MRYFVKLDGTEHVVDVTELPGAGFDVKLVDEATGKSRPLAVEVSSKGGPVNVHVDGRVFDLVVEPTTVFASGRRAAISVESARQRATSGIHSGGKSASTGLITSPMPGKVVKVLVKEGDEVEPGRPLAVVEAMKMENELVAEITGTVKKVHVLPGDAVEGGASLILIA